MLATSMRRLLGLMTLGLFLLTPLSARAADPQEDVVIQWNGELIQIFRDKDAGWDPELAAYTAAITNIAIFDAVNASSGKYRPYIYSGPALPGAQVDAAAATAGHDALVGVLNRWLGKSSPSIYKRLKDSCDALLQKQLHAIPEGSGKKAGIKQGQLAAQAILAARQADGSERRQDVGYSPGRLPGDYELTPPANLPADKPAWGKVKLFALERLSQFPPPGPPALTSAEYTRNFNDVKTVGCLSCPARTSEQTLLAKFWAEQSPGTRTPPGSWIVIAQTLGVLQKNNLLQNARMFALLSIAMADAGIVAWDVKYTYARWRPVTAIRMAQDDGNPATQPDPTWESLLPAPNFPAYFSGHSTFGSAASTALAEFFGTDKLTFTCTSDTVPGVTLTYHSLSKAAYDNGRARIWLGVHMENENVDAANVGTNIGRYVYTTQLTEAAPAKNPEVSATGQP